MGLDLLVIVWSLWFDVFLFGKKWTSSAYSVLVIVQRSYRSVQIMFNAVITKEIIG